MSVHLSTHPSRRKTRARVNASRRISDKVGFREAGGPRQTRNSRNSQQRSQQETDRQDAFRTAFERRPTEFQDMAIQESELRKRPKTLNTTR